MMQIEGLKGFIKKFRQYEKGELEYADFVGYVAENFAPVNSTVQVVEGLKDDQPLDEKSEPKTINEIKSLECKAKVEDLRKIAEQIKQTPQTYLKSMADEILTEISDKEEGSTTLKEKLPKSYLKQLENFRESNDRIKHVKESIESRNPIYSSRVCKDVDQAKEDIESSIKDYLPSMETISIYHDSDADKIEVLTELSKIQQKKNISASAFADGRAAFTRAIQTPLPVIEETPTAISAEPIVEEGCVENSLTTADKITKPFDMWRDVIKPSKPMIPISSRPRNATENSVMEMELNKGYNELVKMGASLNEVLAATKASLLQLEEAEKARLLQETMKFSEEVAEKPASRIQKIKSYVGHKLHFSLPSISLFGRKK